MQTDNKISKISQYLNEVRQNPNVFWESLSEQDDIVYWIDRLDGDEWIIQDITK